MKNIAAKRKIFLIISAAAMVLVVLVAVVMGPSMGLELGGGTVGIYAYSTGTTLAPADFENTAEEYLGGDVTVQELDNLPTGMTQLVLTVAQGFTEDTQQGLLQALTDAFPDAGIEESSVSTVFPAEIGMLVTRFVIAAVLAGVLLLIFVGLRYKKTAGFSSGVVSLITMMHDCLLTYGVLVLLGFRAGSAFVAAAATVCCCSLINSVILYDAIRENRRVMSVNATVAELLNQSVAQCAPKLLAFTILLALGAVCAGVVGMVLDVTVLDIAVPVLAGVLCAFYSATCLNGALWSLWQERQQGKAAAAAAAKSPKSKGKSKK